MLKTEKKSYLMAELRDMVARSDASANEQAAELQIQANDYFFVIYRLLVVELSLAIPTQKVPVEKIPNMLIDPENNVAGFYIVNINYVPTLKKAFERSKDNNNKVGILELIQKLEAKGEDISTLKQQIIDSHTERVSVPVWKRDSRGLMVTDDERILVVPPTEIAERLNECALLFSAIEHAARARKGDKSILYIPYKERYWRANNIYASKLGVEVSSDETGDKQRILGEISEYLGGITKRKYDQGLVEFVNLLESMVVPLNKRDIKMLNIKETMIAHGDVILRNPHRAQKKAELLEEIDLPKSMEFNAFALRLAKAFPKLGLDSKEENDPTQAGKRLYDAMVEIILILQEDRLSLGDSVQEGESSLVLKGVHYIDVTKTKGKGPLKSLKKKRGEKKVRYNITSATADRDIVSEIGIV